MEAPDAGPAPTRVGRVRGDGRRGRARRARDPGERPREPGAEAGALRRDREGCPAGRAHLLVDLGAAPDSAPGGARASGPLPRRASVQPRLPPSARRGRRGRAYVRGGRRPGDRLLRVARDASAARSLGDRRLRRRPAARGPLARGPLARGRRCRHGRGGRRRHPLRPGVALGPDGHLSHVSDRRWRGRNAPLPRPVRPHAAVALDEADGRPRPLRRADRDDLLAVGRAGRRSLHPRARAHPRRQPRGVAPSLARTPLRRGGGPPRARGAPVRGGSEPRRGARSEAAASSARDGGRSVLGRLQRPHDRGALQRGLRLLDRCLPAPRRCRRGVPRNGPQRLHRRGTHPLSRRGGGLRAAHGSDAGARGRREEAAHLSHADARSDGRDPRDGRVHAAPRRHRRRAHLPVGRARRRTRRCGHGRARRPSAPRERRQCDRASTARRAARRRARRGSRPRAGRSRPALGGGVRRARSR